MELTKELENNIHRKIYLGRIGNEDIIVYVSNDIPEEDLTRAIEIAKRKIAEYQFKNNSDAGLVQ